MSRINSSDKKSFENGGQVFYEVSYLGEGPVEDKIPDDIIGRKKENIPGMLYFSLKNVRFEADLEDEFEYVLEFTMDNIESEKAWYESRILSFTLSHQKRRHYFGIAKTGARQGVVYRPYWINYGKNYKK